MTQERLPNFLMLLIYFKSQLVVVHQKNELPLPKRVVYFLNILGKNF